MNIEVTYAKTVCYVCCRDGAYECGHCNLAVVVLAKADGCRNCIWWRGTCRAPDSLYNGQETARDFICKAYGR